MPKKDSGTRTENTYEFDLAHADIVTTMNSSQVQLAGGTVSTTQEFQVILKKTNGTEIFLKDMVDGDTLVFRFKKVVQSDNPVTFNGLTVAT